MTETIEAPPDTPSVAEPEVFDPAAHAREVDEAIVAELQEPTEGKEPSGAVSETKLPGPLQAFVDQRYGGDVQAFVDSLFHNSNQAARHAEEIERLHARIEELATGKGKGEDEVTAAVAATPEITQLDQDLREVQAETKAATDRSYAVISEHKAAELAVAKLEGALERADDIDKPSLRDELRTAKASVKELESEWKDLQRALRTNNGTEKRLSREREALVAQVKDTLSQRGSQEQAAAASRRAVREHFQTVFETEAKKYGIDPTTQDAGYLLEGIKARITMHLRSLPPDAPPLDLEATVASLMQAEAAARKLTASSAFARASSAARETRAPVAPAGTRTLTDSSLSKLPEATLKDGKFWRERAQRLSQRR